MPDLRAVTPWQVGQLAGEDRVAATLPPPPQYVPGRMVSGLGVPQAAPVPLDGQPVPTVITGATPAPIAPIRAPTSNGADRSAYAPWSTDQLADYFVQNKALALTPDQARGVARWLHDRESKGDPFAYNPAGGGAGAFGVEQARGPRARAMLALYGPTPTTQQQVDFAIHEFVTSEKGALQAIKNSSSEQAAYDAMGAKFERPEGTPPGLLQAGASPDYSNIVARSQQMADRESAEIRRLTAEADKADPDSQLRHQRLQQAMDHSERLSQQFEEMSRHPPTETPLDMMQNFGSLATVIALAGGLLAKRPLTAALNAAGSAMRAQQEGNHEQAQRAYRVWQDQTELISRALNFQNQEINQIMEDRRISEAERRDKIAEHLRLYGMQQALDQWNLGNEVEVHKLIDAQPKVALEMDHIRAETAAANARAAGRAEGSTFSDRQTDALLQVRAKELNTTVEDLRKNHPEEVVKAQRQVAENKPATASQVRAQEKRADAADEVDSTINLVDTTMPLISSASTGLGGRASEVAQGIAGIAGINLGTQQAQFAQHAEMVQAQIRNELIKSHYMSKGAIEQLDEIVPGLGLLDDPVTVRQRWQSLRELLVSERNRLRSLPGAGGEPPKMSGSGTEDDPFLPTVDQIETLKPNNVYVDPRDPDNLYRKH